MASAMKAYTTRNALKTVVENFRKPRQLFMYHPIQFEINGTFPTTKTELFSKNVNGTTYWLANMTNEYERDRQILTHDGKFREEDFLAVFDEFCKTNGLFAGSKAPSTVAEKCYTKAIEKYMKKNNIKAEVQNKSSHFFAMNESQMFKYRHYDDGTLPDGYSIDVPEPTEDVLKIVGSSTTPKLVEEKLRRFPSLCVRKGGELVGFISSESHGALAHLHVSDSHRGQNLGEKLEIGAAKVAIENGIRPDAIERNIQLEKECLAAREREADNAKVINALSSRIKTFEMEKREEIDAMTNEKKSLLEELLDMQKRIDELAPACAEKELKIVATDNEKLDLTKRLRHANSDLSHLQAALKHLHEEIASKDNEIKALNDEIQFLKSRILATEEETRKMRIEDSESQDRISFYIQQSRELELTSINDKKLIDKVMEENSSLIKENARISTKLSRLETLEFSIKQKEVKETQTNSELVSELKAALQLEKSSSHILQNKIEIMRQRCEDLEKTILDRDRSEDENTAERSRVEKELNALHALSKSLSSENKILREEKLTNEEIIDELKGKIRALEMGIRSAQEIYQEKERQNAAKIQELAEDASKKHKKYLEFEEISKTLHQITALLPSKTLGMTQPSHRDCSK